MTYTQALALRAQVLEMFPYLQEVNVSQASQKNATYFVGLWYNSDVLMTLSSEHQYKNLVAFIARAACQIEVAS